MNNIQALALQERTTTTKPYVLYDDGGLYISFDTAQEAFDWIAVHTPDAPTEVSIIGNRTLTEGRVLPPKDEKEIVFEDHHNTGQHFLKTCTRCRRTFDDRYRLYYPCPEHPYI